MALRRLPTVCAVAVACALGALFASAPSPAAAPPVAPDPAWWAPDARLLLPPPAPQRPAAGHFTSGLKGWTLLGPGAVTVRTGGPGGHYAALRDNTTLESPPLAVAVSQQVLLITARAPVGSPIVDVSAVDAHGGTHALGDLQPSASWGTYAFNADGLTGQKVRLVLDPVMGLKDAVDLARVGESEQVARGMTLVHGAARRAIGPPAGALLTAGGGQFELRTATFRLPHDAATVSVWIRGLAGLRPIVALSAGGRALGTAIAGPSWQAVRVPVAALRGRRVALAIGSSDSSGLQLAFIGTVQRAPALRVRRFLPPAQGSPPGSPIGVAITGSPALAGAEVTLQRLRAGIWRRVGGVELRLKSGVARAKLTAKLPKHVKLRAVYTGSEAVAPGSSPVRTRRA